MSCSLISSTGALVAILLCSITTYAADNKAPPPPSIESPPSGPSAEPETAIPPDLPPDGETASDSRETIKPEVTIIHKEDATIEEYRVGGRLRYAKIIPKVGKPYYMVDTNGDGTLDTRYNDMENPPVNQWILMEW